MDKDVKVKDYPGMYRRANGAIVNKDKNLYELARARLTRAQHLLEMETRLTVLESQLTQIIDLLQRKI